MGAPPNSSAVSPSRFSLLGFVEQERIDPVVSHNLPGEHHLYHKTAPFLEFLRVLRRLLPVKLHGHQPGLVQHGCGLSENGCKG